MSYIKISDTTYPKMIKIEATLEHKMLELAPRQTSNFDII